MTTKTSKTKLLAQHVSLRNEEYAANGLLIAKQAEISNFEIDESEHEESYIDALDCKGTVSAGGYDFYPSRILKELDPIAYGCGITDFVDGLDVTDEEDYQILQSELEELESEVELIQSQIEEVEESLEELEG